MVKIVYQCEQDEEARDVRQHSSKRDLESSEDFEGGHEEGGACDAEHIRDRKQDVRYNFRVVGLPIKSS